VLPNNGFARAPSGFLPFLRDLWGHRASNGQGEIAEGSSLPVVALAGLLKGVPRPEDYGVR
jgi:hypothetical protein